MRVMQLVPVVRATLPIDSVRALKDILKLLNFSLHTYRSYDGSGLPQGPFWRTISNPLKVG